MASPKAKRWIRLAGNVLSVLAVVFIAQQLVAYHDELKATPLLGVVPMIILLSVVYAGACAFTAMGWYEALKHVGQPISIRSAQVIYGTSQLAKYVPGNVFHLASRQGQGMAEGLPGWALAKSMFWELATLSLSAALFAFLLIPLVWPAVGPGLALLVYLMSLVVMVLVLSLYQRRHLALALLWNSAFMTVNGFIFGTLLFLMLPEPAVQPGFWLIAVPAYILAWLGGFLTPGAPAGVGVRELIAFALLQSWYPEAIVLAAVLGGRIISVCGDVLFFGLALWLRRTSPPESRDSSRTQS